MEIGGIGGVFLFYSQRKTIWSLSVRAVIFWCRFFAPWFFYANAYFRWSLASISMKQLWIIYSASKNAVGKKRRTALEKFVRANVASHVHSIKN